VSLAAALALPLTTSSGQAFPQRNLIIFYDLRRDPGHPGLQGLTLPWLIRRLGLQRDDGDEQEELRGCLRATDAALARLEEFAAEGWTRDDTVERMRGLYQFRRRPSRPAAATWTTMWDRGPLGGLPAAGPRAAGGTAPRDRAAPQPGRDQQRGHAPQSSAILDLEDARLEI
jgi:hypothetical protein